MIIWLDAAQNKLRTSLRTKGFFEFALVNMTMSSMNRRWKIQRPLVATLKGCHIRVCTTALIIKKMCSKSITTMVRVDYFVECHRLGEKDSIFLPFQSTTKETVEIHVWMILMVAERNLNIVSVCKRNC